MPRSGAVLLEARIPGLVDLWRGEFGRRGEAPRGRLSRDETRLVGDALLSLQRGLTGGRELAGAGYMDRPDLLGAYFLYYWPVSYLQVSLAAEACLGKTGRKPIRVLDLGSGPGPASAALLDSGARGFLLVDSSAKAMDVAQRAIAQGASPEREAGVAPAIATLEADLEAEPASIASRIAAATSSPFDLLVASHSLNELFKGREDRVARRAALLEGLSGLLAPGGIILLVEPSLLSTSRDLLALRDLLAARGYGVLAPCPSCGPCPALAAGPGQTCHAEAAWDPPEPVASLAAAAGLDRASVKMSYIGLATPSPAAADRPGKPCDESCDTTNTDIHPADGADGSGGRGTFEAIVVSEPMLNKAGRVRFVLCGRAGRFTLSARRDDAAARAAGFFGLARYDRIRVSGAEERPGQDGAVSFGFAPGTRLAIEPSPRTGTAKPAETASRMGPPARKGRR
jgi:SAM-dependent methyltransferase